MSDKSLKLLDRYAQAIEDRDSDIQQNKAVFEKHEQIVMRIIDAENDLRDEVAETNEGVTNGSYTVTITPETQTFADIEVLDRLVADGNIKKEFRDAIVKTNVRPPRIRITKI